MSTEASDSSAFSCWTSAPRRAIRSAATANVRLVSRISPSGTSVTTAATAVGIASLSRRVPMAKGVAEDEPERDHHADEGEEQNVQPPLEGRARMPERPCLADDARRVALVADGGHRELPDALGDERGRADLVAGLALQRPATRRSGSTRRGQAHSPTRPSRRRPPDSPACTRMRSPTTTPSTPTSRTAPSRTTVAVGATSAARRSSARFARTSCTMPIAELKTRMPRKSESCHSP